MKNNPLVSIIIPTKNSSEFLNNCLNSIRQQKYINVEVLIIDGNSKDNTVLIAKKHKCRIFNFVPKVKKGTFDAPHKRNYGVLKARGELVYYLDADMELTKNVLKEAVYLCIKKYDAVIIKEDSFGIGVWAKAKNLERRCYWGDDTVEAPRFFKKTVWNKLGGLDESLGGGGDDWDLYQKLLKSGYKIGRTVSYVRHNEGRLSLFKLIKKRFMYGRDSFKYISKRPAAGVKSYFPIRMSYLKNWKMFISKPFDTFAFIVMRFCEYTAGFGGVLYSLVK